MATLHGFYGGAGHSLQPVYFANCVKRFKKWLSRLGLMPRTIFEIGTGSGLASCCWADMFNLPVTSIDIADQRYICKGEHNTERPNLVRLVGDCFQGCGEDGVYDPSVYPLNTFMDLLRRHTEEPIERNGRLMLLCDGSDKVKEAKTFAPWLRDGDLLLLHDWFRDETTFARHQSTGAWTITCR